MAYADALRLSTVKFNDVANLVEGVITRVWGGTTAGSAAAYTASVAPVPTGYAVGMILSFLPHVANSGTCTLNLNGLGARNILYGGYNLGPRQLLPNALATAVYDGTYWHLLNESGGLTTYTLGVSGDGTMPFAAATVDRAVYLVRGDLAWVSVSLVGTTSGTASTTVGVGLPVAASQDNQPFATLVQDGAGWRPGVGYVPSSNFSAVTVAKSDGTNWGLGAGRRVSLAGWYRRA